MEKSSRVRFPLMALGLVALLTAMWAGLIRLGWGWPALRPTLPMSHGPLMISGFLGTLIGIERVVALSTSLTNNRNRRWTYIGPLLTGIGALLLIVGAPGILAPLLMTLGSLSLTLVFGLILRMQLALFTITMAAGALLWLTGNLLWLLGWPIATIVNWWSGFLILTIAGERLELGRVLRLSRKTHHLFGLIIGFFLFSLCVSLANLDIGARLASAGQLSLALWLLRYDVARHTIRKSGLTRFMAASLLGGYGWLAFGGALSLSFGGVTAGFYYDAVLHAVFIGFVMAMIFAHAPIIFPAITGKPIPFHVAFYTHLALLHLSLLVRIIGDLTAWLPGRQWGGLLNVVAILLFLANTLLAIRQGASPKPSKMTPQGAA